MSTEQRHLNGFEERLLVELRREVVARGGAATSRTGRTARTRLPLGWRRRVALAGAVAVVLGAGAAVGVPILSGGSAAYAVTSNNDGTVSVEISSLSDASGLERKLREAGLPAVVRYLPLGKACKAPWFTPWQGSGGPAMGMSGAAVGKGGATRFTIDPGDLPAGVTLVITTQAGVPANAPSGAGTASAISVAFAQGEVGPCEVVDAAAGAPPIPAPAAGSGETPSLHTAGSGKAEAGLAAAP